MALQRPALIVLTVVLGVGTLYSVVYNTYLDTSDPFVATLPHPLAQSSYFARKSNILNQLFIKKAWGWTSLVFFLLFASSPAESQTRSRFFRWCAATFIWAVFTSWFFGPGLGARFTTLSGGECIVRLPSGALHPVSPQYCATNEWLSPYTHSELFPAALNFPNADWRTKARLYRGHDVSGHIFLLTMSVLFLAEHMQPVWRLRQRNPMQNFSLYATYSLLAIWVLAVYTTGVYFHTPSEKFTGYLIGIAGYLVTQLPYFQDPMPAEDTLEAAHRD